VRDVCLLICDVPGACATRGAAVREKTIEQTCIDLLRNFFNHASKRNCAQLAEDLKLLYRAQSEFGALDRSAEFSGNREKH
jgi:transposase-like protein